MGNSNLKPSRTNPLYFWGASAKNAVKRKELFIQMTASQKFVMYLHQLEGCEKMKMYEIQGVWEQRRKKTSFLFHVHQFRTFQNAVYCAYKVTKTEEKAQELGVQHLGTWEEHNFNINELVFKAKIRDNRFLWLQMESNLDEVGDIGKHLSSDFDDVEVELHDESENTSRHLESFRVTWRECLERHRMHAAHRCWTPGWEIWKHGRSVTPISSLSPRHEEFSFEDGFLSPRSCFSDQHRSQIIVEDVEVVQREALDYIEEMRDVSTAPLSSKADTCSYLAASAPVSCVPKKFRSRCSNNSKSLPYCNTDELLDMLSDALAVDFRDTTHEFCLSPTYRNAKASCSAFSVLQKNAAFVCSGKEMGLDQMCFE